MTKRRKALEKLATGILAFVMASLALFSFQEAVFEPLKQWLVLRFGDGWLTFFGLLIISSTILIYVLKRKLPFTK